MKTTIIGYPRVGSKRELKKATESYFKGKISKTELNTTATVIRNTQWQLLKQTGIDLIPSGDFSFYDLMLDTAFMLNIIPSEYKNLKLDDIDTYFAAAHGYQGPSGDVKALPMKKWFNTNYHYIVPKITAQTNVKLVDTKPFDMYTEAKNMDIETKPVLLGPFSFLKLSDVSGNIAAHKVGFISAYKDILRKFNELGAKWIQFDEPSLVTDLDRADIALFTEIYDSILKDKGSSKVLLQTYFGDVRDIYNHICDMSFDGIGLDFIEGKKNLNLIEKYGFPQHMQLFAGIINGRNIWKNNYTHSLSMLHFLENHIDSDRIVLSSSCSLLHVPYSTAYETKLNKTQRNRLSFAQEKLNELCELKSLYIQGEYIESKNYIKNKNIFVSLSSSQLINQVDSHTKKESNFKRIPNLDERKKIQQESLQLKTLPLTTIGSFPQTLEVKSLRKKYRRGELSQSEYKTSIKEKIAEWISYQENIGLDVLVHGEFERNDMVEYFGENLDGFLFTQNGWVQSYGTRCVKPPIIFSDIKRLRPITIEYTLYAQSLTKKPVKGMLTGPVTILNWSFPREDIPKGEIAFQISRAIKDEVLDLEAAGIKIIQIDEAALKEKLPIRKTDWYSEYLSWAIPAFRAVHCDVMPETQIHTHMCYSEFNEIINSIEDMDADVISFEAARSNLNILEAICDTGFNLDIGPGVYDIHSPRVPSVIEIEGIISKMLDIIPKEKLWINPDCGLKTRGEKETKESLENMIRATINIRKTLG